MKATELLKEFLDIINSSSENGEYGKATFNFNLAIHSRFLVAIKEIEDLKAENRAFKKTLDMYFDEMIELRKCNQDLLNTVIEAQKVIKNVLEFKK